MNIDGSLLEFVIACILLFYGFRGVAKQEITIVLGHYPPTQIPLTIKGGLAVISGFAFLVGGILLILNLWLNLPNTLGAIGCWLPILMFAFSFLIQSIKNLGGRINKYRQRAKANKNKA